MVAKGFELINQSRYCTRYKGVTTLLVDFSKVNFLEPKNIVCLACLIEEYHHHGISIQFVPGKYVVDKYLTNIKFYNYWTPNFDRNAYTETQINTTLCLWHICREMIDSYAHEAAQYFQHLFPGKNLEALNISLAEIFNNIFDHANTPYDGYVLTQYYPNLNVIKIAVCDLGIGIPAKINQYWTSHKEHPLTEADALRAAFKNKVSTKSTPRNKGVGLTNLLTLVQNLDGTVEVVSNNALLIAIGKQTPIRTYQTSRGLGGTLLSVLIKTDNLPDDEDIIDIGEFTL